MINKANEITLMTDKELKKNLKKDFYNTALLNSTFVSFVSAALFLGILFASFEFKLLLKITTGILMLSTIAFFISIILYRFRIKSYCIAIAAAIISLAAYIFNISYLIFLFWDKIKILLIDTVNLINILILYVSTKKENLVITEHAVSEQSFENFGMLFWIIILILLVLAVYIKNLVSIIKNKNYNQNKDLLLEEYKKRVDNFLKKSEFSAIEKLYTLTKNKNLYRTLALVSFILSIFFPILFMPLIFIALFVIYIKYQWQYWHYCKKISCNFSIKLSIIEKFINEKD